MMMIGPGLGHIIRKWQNGFWIWLKGSFRHAQDVMRIGAIRGVDMFYDQNESRDERDAALERVLNHNAIWQTQILNFIENHIPFGWVGTGEDIRRMANEDGLKEPNHPNAWGAVIMVAMRYKKFLQPTGRVVNMRKKSSHARLNREYVRMDPY